MTMDESHAVLDELKSLAAEQGWTQVTGFVAQVETADRQILVAYAPGVDPEPLAAWLRSREAAATVRTAELDALAADPGPALAVDRVVIALRCGDLLMPATIAGAATVMGRPAGSHVIVLTGAERIQGETDLATVQRAVGGALLGPEGAARRAGRGLLLWSEFAVPGFLVGRVENDSASLSQWLATVPDRSAEMTMQRAARALALAGQAEAAAGPSAAAQPTGQAGMQIRMLPALRTSVADLHARVLDHLDAQAVSVTRELTASVDTMRHDLLREMDSPAGGRDPRSAELLVTRRMSRWSEDAAQVIAVRQAQTRRHAVQLLGVIDWALVNDVAHRSDGRRYPEPIVQSFTPDPPAAPPHRSGFALPASGVAPGPAWAPALRTATVGGVVTAAALAALGIAVAPAVGAAAVGIAAATMFGSRRGQAATRRRQAETTAIDAAVRDELSRLMSVLSAELDAGNTKLRAAADSEFTDLERSLAAAEQHASRVQAGAVNRDPGVSERLAKLRARLGPGAVSQADRTVLPTDLA